MSTVTLQFVVEEVENQKVVFIVTKYNKIRIEDYYNMVIQDKININQCISQNYENLLYKYQIMKDLIEQNILILDHINYCQMMKGNMYRELEAIQQTTENEEELLNIIQEINDMDDRIYELKFSRFRLDQEIYNLNNEIKKINQIIESKEKLLGRVKGLYYKVLECHVKYYSVFQDITCPITDIFDEYMDDVD
mgnify:CR=1 FL=1